MNENSPIYAKLQKLRREAKALNKAGFREHALEVMRISRGEVQFKTGQSIFGMTVTELDNARSCVTWERLRWAASSVLQRKQLESEEETWGRRTQSWPEGRRKADVIAEVAKEQGVSEESLRRLMSSSDYPNDPESGMCGILILGIHPDWHPDLDDVLFK